MLNCQPVPARTAWKQVWCSNAAAGCQPAPLKSSFGAQRPLRAASPHRCKQPWCSKAAVGCQPAPLGSSFGAQRPLRVASPHRLEAALVLKGRCPARTAPHRLEAALVLKGRCGLQPAALASSRVLKGHCRRLPARTAWRSKRPLRAASPHCLEAALVLKGRCGLPARSPCQAAGLPARTAWKQLWCSKPLRAASPHRLEAALVLKGRCGCHSKAAAGCRLPARTPCKQLWCSKAAAGCQPPRSFLGSFGAQRPLRAASPHHLEAALVLNGRCGLPARTACRSSFGAQNCRCGLPARTAWKQLSRCWAAGCQPAPLGSSFGAAKTASPPLGSSFGAQKLLRAASPHRLEAALVLNSHCGLPARSAWKQLWCSKAAAGCQPAPLGSSFGAQTPLRAASPPFRTVTWKQLWCSTGCQPAPLGSSFGAALRAAPPLRTVCKQLWCSKATAGGCQPAPLAGNSGAQKPLRAASPHCLEAALVLKNRCGLPACTAWKELWCSNAATAARLGSSFGAQNAAADCNAAGC